MPGTHSSTTKRPPGDRWRAALLKHCTCSSWVHRLPMLFHTTYTSENRPGTVVVAMSPVTTGSSSADTLRRSRSTIGCDSSIPVTGTPRAASGIATRPVPIASSSAGPDPASRARKSTAGSRTSGANISAEMSSYRSAVSSSHRSLLVMGHEPARLPPLAPPIYEEAPAGLTPAGPDAAMTLLSGRRVHRRSATPRTGRRSPRRQSPSRPAGTHPRRCAPGCHPR